MANSIAQFLRAEQQAVLVNIDQSNGSVPREQGTWMLVGPNHILGTIGGGQLEFIAMDTARQLIKKGTAEHAMTIPLGPDIGQCCGGTVSLSFRAVDGAIEADLTARHSSEYQTRPKLYIFGAGHVGLALANAASLLPISVSLVDTRKEALTQCPTNVKPILSIMPEAIIRKAQPRSAFVVLTHDHALDFLITKEALLRGDANYVGMIGSKTKRGTFKNWYQREGGDLKQLSRLQCPIGGSKLRDKRPEIIAALTLGEVIEALLSHGVAKHHGRINEVTTR